MTTIIFVFNFDIIFGAAHSLILSATFVYIDIVFRVMINELMNFINYFGK